MGRSKIVIKKIEPEGNRKVTFMKRRGGLLKKAYEISVLADVEVVLMAFAPYINKLCLFSRPNRLEDVLIKYLNMADEHHTVRDENGGETRIAISNKESLITQLENLKLKDDNWAAEQLRIEQANSRPKTSEDDNQSSQYIEMMNSLSSLQKLHQFKRFYDTATPTIFEECFDYNHHMLNFMLSQVTQQMNFVQSMTMNSMRSVPCDPMIHGESSNSQSLLQQVQENWSLGNQTNAGLINMQQQGLAAFHDQKNKQGQGSAYNINQQQQHSVLKRSGSLVIREPNPSSRHMQQGQGSAKLEWWQELGVNFDYKNKGKMVDTEPSPASINVQQGQGSAYNMRQQGLAVFDQKNKGEMVDAEPNPASINMQQGQGSAYNMRQQGLAVFDQKNKEKMVDTESNPASINMQQGQGSAYNMRQQGLGVFDQKNKGKMVYTEPNPDSINAQQGQRNAYNMKQQGLAAVFDQKNKRKMVDTKPNPASINVQQGQGIAYNMQQHQQWASPYKNNNRNVPFLTKGPVQQGQGSANNMQPRQQWVSQYQENNGNMPILTEQPVQQSACNNMQLQKQGASQYQNNGSMIHGSVQAPVKTYNEAESSSNNYNQMELPTGANSSHALPFAPPMVSQNISWNHTYHTTEPPHYDHQQSFGDDVKNWPDLGEYNDKPNSL